MCVHAIPVRAVHRQAVHARARARMLCRLQRTAATKSFRRVWPASSARYSRVPRALQSTTEYPGAPCGTHYGKGPNRALPKLRVSAVWYCVKVANESLPARPAPFGVIDARAQHASGVVAGFHAAAADRCVEACGQLGGPALRGRVVSCQGRCRQFQFQFQRTRLVPVRM